MALFGSNDKTTTTTKKIRPIVVRVQSVAKELVSLAKSYDTKVETIDFNILETQTYTRVNDGKKEAEWEEISPLEISELDDETALLNPFFEIKQMHEIEFFSKNANNPYSKFNIAVGANATKCKIYLSIKSGSKVTYSERFEQDLFALINKAKAKAGILINIFDDMLGETVSKISAHVRVEETAKYTKNETFLIAESYEPTLTINDKIILHYDKKEEVDEHHKIDYASRGFIKNVEKDEIIIEYIKAKVGKPGRNCRGEFMAAKEPQTDNMPTFTVDESIRVEDTPDSIKYIANENGYIALDGSNYTIKTDVEMDNITFKTTGNIVSGLDSDVSINVTEKDAIKDAIGNGMIVEVTEIDIDGNVGSNAKLTAIRTTIGGQTHKTAEIRADKVNINVHKGKAYGKNIKITRLEHGIVDGDIVDIAQALGGNIRAKEVVIELCASHVNVTASKIIEIKKLQGSENTFIIDPLLKKDIQEDLEDNKDNIKELEIEIRNIEKDEAKYTQLIKGNTASFNDVRKRLIHYKKSGVKLPETFVKKYKQFQNMQEKLKNIKESKVVKKNELDIAKSKTTIFQDDIFEARIINRDRWVGYNELIFKMVDPKIDISYKPQEGSSGKVFALIEVEEGEYEIQAVDE